MSTNYTIKELRASITAKGVTFPTRAEIDALVTYAQKKGSRQPDMTLAFHAIITGLLNCTPVTPSDGGRFTWDYVATNCAEYIDIPLNALTAVGGSMTNLNNTYNLPVKNGRVTPATHMGTVGQIGWVTPATSQDKQVKASADGTVRLFRRTPLTAEE